MTRYWIEFDPIDIPSSLILGGGVTANNYEDAMSIISSTLFDFKVMPIPKKITQNIDISTLDEGHIRPNMAPPNVRGIWYPMGYAL